MDRACTTPASQHQKGRTITCSFFFSVALALIRNFLNDTLQCLGAFLNGVVTDKTAEDPPSRITLHETQTTLSKDDTRKHSCILQPYLASEVQVHAQRPLPGAELLRVPHLAVAVIQQHLSRLAAHSTATGEHRGTGR